MGCLNYDSRLHVFTLMSCSIVINVYLDVFHDFRKFNRNKSKCWWNKQHDDDVQEAISHLRYENRPETGTILFKWTEHYRHNTIAFTTEWARESWLDVVQFLWTIDGQTEHFGLQVTHKSPIETNPVTSVRIRLQQIDLYACLCVAHNTTDDCSQNWYTSLFCLSLLLLRANNKTRRMPLSFILDFV